MKPGEVACVVLASGLSERFGGPDKLKAPLCGKSILDHVLDTVSAVGFAEVFLVSRLENYSNVTGIENNAPDKGQGHALRLGVRAARTRGWQNACVMLGDMPLVEASYIVKLIETVTPSQSVISRLGEQTMPPAVFNMAAMEEILAGVSTMGARSLLAALDMQSFPIPFNQAHDIDTPRDLARVEAVMKDREK